MEIPSIETFAEQATSILSILCLLGPMPSSLSAIFTKNVDNLPFTLILLNIFNNSLWAAYTFQRNEEYLLIIFLFGAFIFSVYLIIYLYATNELYKAIFYLSILGLLLYLLAFYVPVVIVGKIASVISLFSYLTYLEPLSKALASKSTKYLNYLMLLLSLLTAASFILYGFLKDDFNYLVPNCMGVILVLLQYIIAIWVKGYISDNCLFIAIMRWCLSIFQKQFGILADKDTQKAEVKTKDKVKNN